MEQAPSIVRELFAGKTLARVLMDEGLAAERVRGRVLDVGGGRHPDYFDYLQKEHVTSIEPVDVSISGIDFEKDALPYADSAADTVVACNVLEHIYNHRFLLGEIRRVLKAGGTLVGFVPFWVGYHPDPHDYFRYTSEALTRLLKDAGFTDVRVRSVGGGPFLANFNTIMLSFPRVLRPILYLPYATLDAFFLKLRPKSRERNPLGFIFRATKP